MAGRPGDLRPGRAGQSARHRLGRGGPRAGLDLACLARTIDNREHFPAGVNLSLARIEAPDRVRARVHERGVGETGLLRQRRLRDRRPRVGLAGRLGSPGDGWRFPAAPSRWQWAGPGHPVWLGGPVRVLGATEPPA
ncbi:MAG: hypothetical protein RML12_10295 [Xanthomonadales bacterium]|nr:hypothetical protein [Xanthomonadales bacterium]